MQTRELLLKLTEEKASAQTAIVEEKPGAAEELKEVPVLPETNPSPDVQSKGINVSADNMLMAIINQANLERPSRLMGEDYVERFENEYMVFNSDYAKSITKDEAENLLAQKDRKESVPYDKAVEDVDLYFRLLRYRMGHYDVLGGDEVFFAAKERVLNRLKSFKGSNVSTSFLVDVLVKELAFVEDCHFEIDHRSVFYENSAYRIYKTYKSGLILEKDDTGYFIQKDKEKYYFNSCDAEGTSIVNFLNKNGILGYTLVLYSPIANKPSQSNADFKSAAGKSITEKVLWQEDSRGNIKGVYSFAETDNIAYISLAGVGDNFESELRQAAEKARQKNICIIDLRSNGGTHAYSFINSYTDDPAEVAEVAFSRVGMTNRRSLQPGEEYNYATNVTSSGHISECDTITIVLVDNETGCAPEEFSEYCRMLTNCIIVGTNTKGHLDGGSMTWDGCSVELYLPNTGICVNISTCLAFYGDFISLVGKGFKPDIYVENTRDCLSAVLSMLNNYDFVKEDEVQSLLQSEEEFLAMKNMRQSSNYDEAVKGFAQSHKPICCPYCHKPGFTYKSKSEYMCLNCKKRISTWENFDNEESGLFCIRGFWSAQLPSGDEMAFGLHEGDNQPVYFCNGKKQFVHNNSWGDGIGCFFFEGKNIQTGWEVSYKIMEYTENHIVVDVTYEGTEYKGVEFKPVLPN